MRGYCNPDPAGRQRPGFSPRRAANSSPRGGPDGGSFRPAGKCIRLFPEQVLGQLDKAEEVYYEESTKRPPGRVGRLERRSGQGQETDRPTFRESWVDNADKESRLHCP